MRKFKENIQEIKKGDIFFASGSFRVAAFDAHPDHYEEECPWVVYDTVGSFWTEEDVRPSNEAFKKIPS